MASNTRFLKSNAQDKALSLIRQALSLPPYNSSGTAYKVRDAVIISIDFENVEQLRRDHLEPHLKTQMGVSILDTKDINTKPIDEVIKTYNFTTGAWRDRDEDFLFGITQQTTIKQLTSELENLIDRKRNIVLLAHDPHEDLAILRKLGFDLNTGIIAILDTQQLAKKVFNNTFHQRSLEDTLTKLGVQHRPGDLHVGGNDANFTLKALLLLVVESLHTDITTNPVEKDVHERLLFLSEIANTPLPPRKIYLPGDRRRSSLLPSPIQNTPSPDRHKSEVAQQLHRLRTSTTIKQPALQQYQQLQYPREYLDMFHYQYYIQQTQMQYLQTSYTMYPVYQQTQYPVRWQPQYTI